MLVQRILTLCAAIGADVKAIRTALSDRIPVVASVPPSHQGDAVYVCDRMEIMQWRVVGSFTGYVSCRLGEIEFGWTPAAMPWQVDAVGSIVNKSAYPALYARFVASGLLIASASWRAGEYRICDVGTTQFRLPDLRNVFLRMAGTDADTGYSRQLGSAQADQLKRHKHTILTWDQSTPVMVGDGVLSTAGGGSVYSTHPSIHGETGGAETRPMNVALHPRIHA